MLEDIFRDEYKRQQKLPEIIARQIPAKYLPFITMLAQNKKMSDFKVNITPELRDIGVWTGDRGTYMNISTPYMTVEGRVIWFSDIHMAVNKKYSVSSNVAGICKVMEERKERLPVDYPLIVWIESEIYGRLEGISRIFWDGSGANKTNPLENAYTSALGRAIGQAGVGLIGTGFASAEEIEAAMTAEEEIQTGKAAQDFAKTSPKASPQSPPKNSPPRTAQKGEKPDWTAFWVTVTKELGMDKDRVLQLASAWRGQQIQDLQDTVKTAEEMAALLAYLRQTKVEPGNSPAVPAQGETKTEQAAGNATVKAADAASKPRDVYLLGPIRYETSSANGAVPHIKIMLLKPSGERVPVMALQGGGMEKFERLSLGEGARVVARLAKLPKSQYYRLEDVEVAAS